VQRAGARFELRSVDAVVDPSARGLNELAGADRRCVAYHHDQVTLAPRLNAQDAEAVVGIVEGDPLDETREVFPIA
jgi:hypothetical protein